MGISKFLERDDEGLPNVLTDEEGGLLIFVPLVEKESFFCGFFFSIKEDHPNYSMLEESLLAYLLYKYTLNRTFIINIKVKCFYCKAYFF